MKFLHLSDLHIGKRIFGVSLLEDQAYILDQIINIAAEADAVLISGDLYDKAAPSAEAVSLCDRFLTRLSQGGRPVFLISGNHDSAHRLAFGARLMEQSGVYISPVYDGKVEPILLQDEWGEIAVYLLPFLKSAYIRNLDPEAELSTAQEAVSWALQRLAVDPSRRNVILAHQLVTGASRCDSEELNIGGLDQVDSALFEPFDYVALGHLHTPQQAGRSTIRYCGTPLKYSFSEAGQQKSVLMVELGKKGQIEIEPRPLRPLRDLVCLRGHFADLMAERRPTEDYTQITLTDEGDIPQAMARLRTVYPNLLSLSYDNARTRTRQRVLPGTGDRQLDPLELVSKFYRTQNNQPLSDGQRSYLAKLTEGIWGEEV